MVAISPFLQNQLANPLNKHDRIYENLAKNANEIKPNENKAVLVQENIFQSTASAIKDTGKDFYNFSKVIKTGEITDNNLGRINNLGMKIGSLLIASYLAIHSKTKTDAAMKFVGGGAFLASMTLWPKLFINLPAKLIHNVDIDKKYISAQGDKKEVFLDNQYILWDILGINKEEDREKHRMIALQNRTLNLATVGVAVPTMTALIGNSAEPFIYNNIVKHNYKKVSKLTKKLESFEKYINNSKPVITNTKELDKLFKSYQKQNKNPDKEMFDKLAQMFNLYNMQDVFKDSDDINVVKNIRTGRIVDEFSELYQQNAHVQTSSLENILQDIGIVSDVKAQDEEAAMSCLKRKSKKCAASSLSDDKIKEIMSDLKKNPTLEKTRNVLKNAGLNDMQIEKILSDERLKTNADDFYDLIKDYNQNALAKIRGSFKAYLDAVNPLAGSKYESVTTKIYNDTMSGLIKKLGINDKTLKQIKESSDDKALEIIENIYKDSIANIKTKDEYSNFIKNSFGKKLIPDEVIDLFDKFSSDEYLDTLKPKNGISSLDKAIVGTVETSIKDPAKTSFSKGSLSATIVDYLNSKKLDLYSTTAKHVVCSNFEWRLKNGKFASYSADEIDIMRRIVYDGTASMRQNSAYTKNKAKFNELIGVVFNKKAFDKEAEVIPGIRKIVGDLKEFNQEATNKEIFFKTGSFVDLFKQQATKLYNSKTWLKKFGKMAIILAGLTLLIQPFFGKVKKDSANQKKDGGAK